MIVTREPPILYFGTPVALLGSTNPDGSANLAPMSSVFWLGWRAVLGLSAASQTAQNIQRTREVTINLPSAEMADAVDRLALTTGADPVPVYKAQRGYRFEPAKFARAGLTAAASETIGPMRVLEAPVQLEARIEAIHSLAAEDETLRGKILTFEARVLRVHLHEAILADGDPNRIDPDKWRPLIMSFQKFYGLGPQVRPSTLASIPEAVYRSPDVDKARAAAAQVAA
ncbi:MAG: flavin reductase family protein [Alphaproteobacteria bacterium]|nr:flavin reductase family protein [Alphaproteobacteria bacterium]